MTTSTKLALYVAVFAAICFALLQLFSGVRVIVRNANSSAMESTTVHVTGRDYFIGDLIAGQERSVQVRPTGESHVEISFSNSNGMQKRIVADCYFETRSHTGTVTIIIANDKLIDIQDDISISVIF